MAHNEQQQPDFQEDPDQQKPYSLARDIEDLNKGMRIDFDQKLSELADLLSRFKALVAPSQVVAPFDNAANDDATSKDYSKTDQHVADNAIPAITPGKNALDEDAAKVSNVAPLFNKMSTTSAEESSQQAEPSTPSAPSPYAPEPARFETGLYKLNSQLYRFRLELDQELEFREEPLHVHFRQESELSRILQKINEKSSEKHPGS